MFVDSHPNKNVVCSACVVVDIAKTHTIYHQQQQDLVRNFWLANLS